jgi:hypothetical protein
MFLVGTQTVFLNLLEPSLIAHAQGFPAPKEV